MKKLLLVIALLAGCAHKQISIERETADLDQLREDIRRLDYYIDHERCFTVYSICLGEKKKPHKECWGNHEACVIRVYKQWKGSK